MAESTLQKINEIAAAEFLEKGFRGASLEKSSKKPVSQQEHFTAITKARKNFFRLW